jgi:hypothetical protein
MIEQFDIFHRDSYGGLAWRWLQVASTIEDAKEQVRQLSVVKPGEYMIFDQAREIKTSSMPERRRAARPDQWVKPG